MSNLERFAMDAEERGNLFLQKLLQKQTQRLSAVFNRLVVRSCCHFSHFQCELIGDQDDQIKAVEQTKLTTKKRKGIAYFIRYFPVSVFSISQTSRYRDVSLMKVGIPLDFPK